MKVVKKINTEEDKKWGKMPHPLKKKQEEILPASVVKQHKK